MESVKESIDERALHKRGYDSGVNERQMLTNEGKVDMCKALDASLVVTESSGTEFEEQNTSNSSRNDVMLMMQISNMYMMKSQWLSQYTLFAYGKRIDVVKPHHVITSSESRNSAKNMPRFSSNDMVHNHYLEEARKKTQESGKISRPSVHLNFSPSGDSEKFTLLVPGLCLLSFEGLGFDLLCVFNANHDDYVTKFLNEINSRAEVPFHKTTKRYKPVEQVSIAKKPDRRIPTGHMFSIKKTSTVHEKTITPRSCLRWKSTGRIFTTVGLRWVPTEKIFTSSTIKVNNKPPHGSNTDITNLHECIQNLDSRGSTSINVQEEYTLDLSAGEDSAYFSFISLFVPSPELSPKSKAEEEKEIPSYTKREQEDVVTEEPKKAKVTKEEPHVTQPEPFQTVYLDKNEHMKRAMKEAKLGKPMIKKVDAKIDELSVIISKKKNKVGSELMTSLSNKYERLKKIPGELGLNLALPLPEQDPSLLKHKRKAMKLEPKTYIVDAFGEPAFQRVNDIQKMETETLLGNKVIASNVKIDGNQRFSMLMSMMINNCPDKEKIMTKRVKLENLGYTDVQSLIFFMKAFIID
nr:hypothetical protein [Tanacetum cinerariifolium]